MYIIWVPGMAAAWVPICKKGVPARNQNILAVSFEFQSTPRGQFSSRCFYPRGPLLPMYLPLASRILRYPPSAEGVGSRTWNTAKGGKRGGKKKKKRRARCPIKNAAAPTWRTRRTERKRERENGEKKDRENVAHLIRAAFNALNPMRRG